MNQNQETSYPQLKGIAHNLAQQADSSSFGVENHFLVNHFYMAARDLDVKAITLDLVKRAVEPVTAATSGVNQSVELLHASLKQLLEGHHIPLEEIDSVQLAYDFRRNDYSKQGPRDFSFRYDCNVQIQCKNGKVFTSYRAR